MIKLDKALKAINPTLKKESVLPKSAKGFGKPSAKSTLGKIASSKPSKQALTPIKSDRGNFQIKD